MTMKEKEETNADNSSYFITKPLTEWIEDAANRPMPKMLFSEFWFENEICILFASGGLGKSVLAVQIADSISKGEPIAGFKYEAEAQKILYFDFELSDMTFRKRYSNNNGDICTNIYPFSKDFLRSELNRYNGFKGSDKDYDNLVLKAIESEIIRTGASVVIIDNITFVKRETEKSTDALAIIMALGELKANYNLSTLVICHCPKRDFYSPITSNHLQGSSRLFQYVESAFTIGEDFSVPGGNIYIKQIKERNTEKIFDSDSVVRCRKIKPHNFLHFEFIGYGREADLLQKPEKLDKEQLQARAVELSQQGCSIREIAKKLGKSVGTIHGYCSNVQ